MTKYNVQRVSTFDGRIGGSAQFFQLATVFQFAALLLGFVALFLLFLELAQLFALVLWRLGEIQGTSQTGQPAGQISGVD